eukprot:1161700-Pelagomonas_calceolata.AAC.6
MHFVVDARRLTICSNGPNGQHLARRPAGIRPLVQALTSNLQAQSNVKSDLPAKVNIHLQGWRVLMSIAVGLGQAGMHKQTFLVGF